MKHRLFNARALLTKDPFPDPGRRVEARVGTWVTAALRVLLCTLLFVHGFWVWGVLVAVLVALLVYKAFEATRAYRRRVRFEQGRCLNCGYDLRGSDGATCPECGAARRES